MKRCPECRRDYYDDTLLYCLDDGNALLEGPTTEQPTAILAGESATALFDETRNGAIRKPPRRMILGAVGLGLIVILGLVWFFSTRTSTVEHQLRSLAVLPFQNASSDPEAEYVSDGLTETLTGSLTQISGFQVKSRSTVFRYKNSQVEPTKAGQELGVDGVITGNLTERGQELTLYVELVDVATGKALWGQTYARPLNALSSLQNDVARDVMTRLRSRTDAAKPRYSQNAEAYRQYLQGRYFFNKSTEEGIRKGIEYFNKAIEIDPNYALAYDGLADSYISLGYDYMPPKNAFPLAKVYAIKAQELDPDIAETHAAIGAIAFFYDWDWSTARREVDHVISLRPETTEPYACTLHYSDALGQPDEAVQKVRVVNEEHPTSLIISSEIACASYYARRFDQAIIESQKTIEMDPTFAPSYYNLGRALGQKGMYDQAIPALAKAANLLDGNSHVLAELSYIYAVSGHKDEAKKAANDLDAIAARRYVDPYLRAVIAIGMGDRPRALALLNDAYAGRSVWMPWLKVEPKFDSLRDEPKFQALIAKMNFQIE